MSMFDPLNQPYGATPVEEEDRQHLLVPHRGIETMAELNDVESRNIADARFWIRDEALDVDDLLSVQCDIHRRMFDHVWDWAGRIRTRELSIGIEPASWRRSSHWASAWGMTAPPGEGAWT
ncbi:hypothetical protein ACFV9C_35980 [Kribbella sp. NPDC059898]|uniref:hypothetical protein n=1 Tax=Kribbella sp. NPDC059898 TaxID=3346995 RepID=UPI0036475BFA